jgi:hypothetical protein
MRLNRKKSRLSVRPSLDILDPRIMLTGIPSETVSIGRVPSAWTADEIGSDVFRVKYSVYNDQDSTLSNVRVTTTLASAIDFVSATDSGSIAGSTVTWTLPSIAPYSRSEVEVTLRRNQLSSLIIDTGATVTGIVDGATVSDSALPLALRSGSILPGSLSPTVDADAADPFVMAKAAELDQDPTRIFEYLTTQIDYESYAGSLRGARGTLWAGAGNSLDVSNLGIALLRASGVPAVYDRGTLSDSLAGELIASMFPEPYRVAGFIPDGTTVSDPVHDPKLLAETRDHFWIRYDSGAGMTALDPLFEGATPGQVFASPSGTFAEVPDEMRHKVTVRIDREMVNTAVSGLFGMDPRQTDTALQVTFPAARLVGRPLAFGSFVSSSTMAALGFSSTVNTYAPYLAEGDLAYPLTHDHVIRGTDFQETVTNFPFGSVILTGIFLTIETTSPDGVAETLERTLFDRIGYDVRTVGGSPNLSIAPGTTAVSELDITTIDMSVGIQPSSAVIPLHAQVVALQNSLQAQRNADGTMPAEASDELRLFSWGISRLNLADYLTISGYDRSALADRLLVKSYADRPIVVLSSTRLVSGEDGSRLAMSLDLRDTEVRTIPYPGQSPAVIPVFNIMRGMRESGIETDVIASASPASEVDKLVSTARVFEIAGAQGIDFVVHDASQASAVAQADYSAEAKARISSALASGLIVIVPSRSVIIDGQSTVAWYETDPTTGRTIGVTADGGHQAISEFVSRLVMTILEDLAIGAVIAAWDVLNHPEVLNDPVALKDYANRILNPITLASAAKEGLAASMTRRLALGIVTGLIGVIVSNFLQGLLVGALLSHSDPAAPDFLVSLDPLPELSDLPQATGEMGVAVAKDPLLVLPVGGSLLPTVFRVGIRNFGQEARKFRLTDLVAPAGFEIVTSLESVIVPAGQTAEIGLALRPIGSIPAPGTNGTFSFRVEDVDDPAKVTDVVQPFVVPAFGSLIAEIEYDSPGVLPGQSTEATLVLRSVGNVGVNVAMTLLASESLSVTGLANVVLTPGEVRRIPLILTVAQGTPLNSTLTASIRADFGGEEPVWAGIPVRVVAPGADAIVDAAKAARDLGKPDLGARLDDLGIALTRLATDSGDPVARDQAVNAIDSIIAQLSVDPVLSAFVADLDAARDALESANGTEETLAAIVTVGAALDDFGAGVEALRRGDFTIYMLPNQRVARPNQPEQFEIVIQNVGTESTVYRIGLPQLPGGVTASLSATTITLAPGQTGSVFLTITQTSQTEVLTFGFTVPVTLDEAPEIGRGASGSFIARREFVSIVDVTATPPFGNGGTQVVVKTRILNAVNARRDVLVKYFLRDSGGNIVRTGTSVAATLDVVTSISTIDLGTIDTTGLADGSYRLEVETTELSGEPVLGGNGGAAIIIGSPVKASISVDKSVLPPGTQTVTTTLEIDANVTFDSPFNLKSQQDFPGVRGVVAYGNYVYAGGTAGLRIYDMTDPASPQLVRTFGTFGQMLEVHGGKLYSVRGSGYDGNIVLDIYSLTDPANPQLLGSTPGIPYSNAWHMVVTDTHVFVSIWSFSFLLGGNDIKYQTGDLLSINVENPAAPFLEDVLLNTYGTNRDGIEQFLNVDISGGDGTLWQIVAVSPDTLLVAGSTAKGDDTQTGQGVVHVIDISDPANMKIVKSLTIPGTVAAVALAVEGNRAIVTGSTAGWADRTGDLDLLGNMVVATLDLTDPRSPTIIRSETLDRPSAGPWAQFAASLGNGLFVVSSPGVKATDPELMVIDISDPSRPVIGSTDVPSLNHGLDTRGGYVFASSDEGLFAWQVGAPTAVPATVSVPIPKGSTTIVPGSFSLQPTRIIDGSDSVIYEWDLDFSSAQSSRTITWQTLVTGMQPGTSTPVNLEGSVSFVSQGTSGEIALPRSNVATEQILSIDPASQSTRRGEAATYIVRVRNLTDTGGYYSLAVLGIPADWFNIPASVFVPAGGFADAELKITPSPFSTDANYRIVVEATSGSISGIVGAELDVQDLAILPSVDTESWGVFAQIDPATTVVGPGTSGIFTVRVTNTGSATDTYSISAIGVPNGFLLEWLQPEITVRPGEFMDVRFRITGQQGVQPGDFGFSVKVASLTHPVTETQVTAVISVLAQGVTVDLNPGSGRDNSPYFATITNTGKQVDTFQLSLGGSAGPFASLGSNTVTLAPGESIQVRVDLGSLAHAIPGLIDLAVYAVSQGDSRIRGGDTARVILDRAEGVSAVFDQTRIDRTAPGISRFMLRVVNTGNVESTYRAILETSNGPVIVSILGFDGVSPLGDSTFRLPAKGETWIPVYLDLLQLGSGTATIRVVSSIDGSVAALATASVGTQTSISETTTTLTVPENGWPQGLPVPLAAEVAAADSSMPQGSVRFVIDGIVATQADLVLSNGRMIARTSLTLPPGAHSIRAEFIAGDGYEASQSQESTLIIADDPVQSDLGPQITAVVRYGYHAQPTSFAVTFDSDLDPASAGSASNYLLIGAGRDGRFGTKDDRVIRLRSVGYDAVTRTATLNCANRLALRARYQLIAKGSAGGIRDTAGRLLDGNADGKSGGDYVRILDQRDLAGPAPNFRRLAATRMNARNRK